MLDAERVINKDGNVGRTTPDLSVEPPILYTGSKLLDSVKFFATAKTAMLLQNPEKWTLIQPEPYSDTFEYIYLQYNYPFSRPLPPETHLALRLHFYDTPQSPTRLHNHNCPIAAYPVHPEGLGDLVAYQMPWELRGPGEAVLEHGSEEVRFGCPWAIHAHRAVWHSIHSTAPYFSVVLADITNGFHPGEEERSIVLGPKEREAYIERALHALGKNTARINEDLSKLFKS